MTESITIKGLPELQRALFKFSDKLGTKVTQVVLKKGANYMAGQIRAAAPVKTGRLRRSVSVRNSRIVKVQRSGHVGVYILVGGRARSNPRGAWYGKFVELGYNRGSKQVSGSEAIRLGLITKGQKDALKLRYKANRLKNARPGFKPTKVGAIRVRHGGVKVEGRHFVLNTFNRTARTSLDIIVEASNRALLSLGKELNLNVGVI